MFKIIKLLFYFFSRFFHYKFFISLLNFLRLLVSLKGMLSLLTDLLRFFALKLLVIASKIQSLLKTDISLVLGLSSVFRYFINKFDLPKIFTYFTFLLELLALSALFTTAIQTHSFSIDGAVAFLNSLFNSLQDFFKDMFETIKYIFNNPINYFKEVLSKLQSFLENKFPSKAPEAESLPELITP